MKRPCIYIGVAITAILLGTGGFLIWFFLRPKDYCKLIANKNVVNYDEVINCYQSFSLNKDRMNQVMDLIEEKLPFSSLYTDVKQGPDPNVTVAIDIAEDLKGIRKFIYHNEYEFHIKLAKYFKKLQEGHHKYRTMGFDLFKFQLPISLYAVHEQNQLKVKISKRYAPSDLLDNAWNELGVKYPKYFEDEVIEISGQDPILYLQEFADEMVGDSRDANTRLRRTLAYIDQTSEHFKVIPGFFTILQLPPNQAQINLLLKNNGLVTIPYLAPNPKGFSDKDSYESTYLQPEPSQLFYKKSFVDPPIIDSVINATLVFKGEFMSIHTINNDAVLHIYSFTVNLPQSAGWKKEIPQALQKLQELQPQKLIFELSNNPGGRIFYAIELLEYFFPLARKKMFKNYLTNSPQLRNYIQKFKDNYIVEKLMIKNKLSGKYVADIIKQVDDQSNASFPHINFNFTFKNEEFIGLNLTSSNSPLPNTKLAVLTNSVCFSSCAIFVNWIQEMTNIPTFSLSGLTKRQSTVGTVVGGSAFNGNANLDEAFESIIFQTFPQPTNFTFTFHGMKSITKPHQPLDLTWLPAQFTIH